MAGGYFVDSHCHLDFPQFQDDWPGVVTRARAAGVTVLQSISTRLSTFPALLARVTPLAGVYCSVGVHPHQAGEEGLAADDPEPLIAHSQHPKVIGIGEAGLDYYYDHAPRARQAANFRAHIKAARQTDLPMIVHTRDADADTLSILQEEMALGPFPCLIHCYSSSPELGRAAVEMGCYLGIGGIATFKRSEELRATLRQVPLARVLLETDAPYLAPVPYRGKTNEPAYIPHIAATVAEVYRLSLAEVARATTDNFHRLFTRAARPSAAQGTAPQSVDAQTAPAAPSDTRRGGAARRAGRA